MENSGKITNIVVNFIVDDNIISDYWMTKCFENGDEVTQNFNSITLMMEDWCYFSLLGYNCTTNVKKEGHEG